jgi:hypothetical protein
MPASANRPRGQSDDLLQEWSGRIGVHQTGDAQFEEAQHSTWCEHADWIRLVRQDEAANDGVRRTLQLEGLAGICLHRTHLGQVVLRRGGEQGVKASPLNDLLR